MLTITHAETVAAYPHQFSQPCTVIASGWPYECEAKRRNPDHDVFTCTAHSVWWHRPRGIAHDFRPVQAGELYFGACSCGWQSRGTGTMPAAITMHRSHAGEPAVSDAWCPLLSDDELATI